MDRKVFCMLVEGMLVYESGRKREATLHFALLLNVKPECGRKHQLMIKEFTYGNSY